MLATRLAQDEAIGERAAAVAGIAGILAFAGEANGGMLAGDLGQGGEFPCFIALLGAPDLLGNRTDGSLGYVLALRGRVGMGRSRGLKLGFPCNGGGFFAEPGGGREALRLLGRLLRLDAAVSLARRRAGRLRLRSRLPIRLSGLYRWHGACQPGILRKCGRTMLRAWTLGRRCWLRRGVCC
jgi:hypothetical protein